MRNSLVPIGSASVKGPTLSGRYTFSNSGILKLRKYRLVVVPAPSYTFRSMGMPLSSMGTGRLVDVFKSSHPRLRAIAIAFSRRPEKSSTLGAPAVRAPVNRGQDQGTAILAVNLGDLPYHDLLRRLGAQVDVGLEWCRGWAGRGRVGNGRVLGQRIPSSSSRRRIDGDRSDQDRNCYYGVGKIRWESSCRSLAGRRRRALGAARSRQRIGGRRDVEDIGVGEAPCLSLIPPVILFYVVVAHD